MTFATWFSSLEAAVQKDEKWVVAEIAKGWAFLENAETTVAMDVTNVFAWIKAHQGSILALFQAVLSEMALMGSVVPGLAPFVAPATTAIDVATAAIDALSRGITAGSTPMATIAAAYHSVKDAQTAVNAVLKQASSKKSTATSISAAPVPPPSVVAVQ